ncbi:hypothetical protein DVA81_19235, partial [Acinetobacter baumannii]
SSPLTLPAQTEKPAAGRVANAERTAENPSGNTSTDATTPVSPTKKRLEQQTHTAPKKEQTDATDSKGPAQQPNISLTQDTHKPN